MSAAAAPVERTCENHPNYPAIAVCSLCGRDICGQCHSTTLTGYAVCLNCPVAEQLAPKTTWEKAQGLGHAYAFFHTCVAVLSNPRTFFSFILPKGDWVKPTILGLICTIFGSLIGLAYQVAFMTQFGEIVTELATQLSMSRTNATLMLFMSVPWSSMFIYIAHLGILGLSLQFSGVEKFDWSVVARIVGYSNAAHLFMIIPPVMEIPVGHFFSIVWLFNLEITGVQQFFKLTFGRTMLAVIPGFLVMALFGT